MDPVSVATIVGSFLVPYAKAAIEKVGEGAAKKVGETAGEEAVALWKRAWNAVKGAFQSEEEITTLNLFERNPTRYQGPVEEILTEKVKQDPALASRLDEILRDAARAGSSTGASIVNADVAGIVDLRGGSVSGSGVIAGVNIGAAALGRTNRPSPEPTQD